MECCAEMERGRPAFIGSSREQSGTGRWMVVTVLQRQRDMGEERGRCSRLWRCSVTSWFSESVVKHSGAVRCPTGQRRTSRTRMVATGHRRGNGGVQGACMDGDEQVGGKRGRGAVVVIGNARRLRAFRARVLALNGLLWWRGRVVDGGVLCFWSFCGCSRVISRWRGRSWTC